MLGTCAGMILLAERIDDGDEPLFGLLDIAVRRNGYGRQLDSFEADLDAAPLGEAPLHGVFIRAPMVTGVGQGVEVLARDPDGTPVAVRQGRVLATAFHPELTGDRRIHALLRELIAEGAARST
jgi:5'-phosphate synthase pdxT subunit